MYYIPALLQTKDYAGRIINVRARKIEPGISEQRVEARICRQQRLEEDDPPRYRALLDEAVLHRAIGGTTVMANAGCALPRRATSYSLSSRRRRTVASSLRRRPDR
jgi:Domain of unknown function (DUF5753)